MGFELYFLVQWIFQTKTIHSLFVLVPLDVPGAWFLMVVYYLLYDILPLLPWTFLYIQMPYLEDHPS